eukprot:2816774-Amphidinium_carterae.1
MFQQMWLGFAKEVMRDACGTIVRSTMQSGALCARRWSVQLILQDPLPRKVPLHSSRLRGADVAFITHFPHSQ